MAALIKTLDSMTPRQVGENGLVENAWSNDLQERIVQLSFQLVRTNSNHQIVELIKVFRSILDDIFYINNYNNSISIESRKYLSIIYRMIANTRDIIDGKGEYYLTYILIYNLYDYSEELALYMIDRLVLSGEDGEQPYGSWKDIKYLCNQCKDSDGNITKERIVKHCIKLINNQLFCDISSEKPSLLAKWIPREGSVKFGWLFTLLAQDFYSYFIKTANNDKEKLKRAIKKCHMEYRRIVTALNKKLDTTQIKQCGKEWANIKFNNVTSITLTKQRKAFLNLNKKGEQRSELEDRIECAANFNKFIEKVDKGEVVAKGQRVGLVDFCKNAYSLRVGVNDNEIKLLNAQWVNNSLQNGKLDKFIAMVDVSGSMSGDPMDAAIALGIRVAEKSALGKRILTFSQKPTWVNLDGDLGFVQMVHKVKHADWGMNTDFFLALQMILDGIVASKLSAEETEGMVLAIFSDMQMDTADTCNKQTLYENISRLYAETGVKVCGKPYSPPHILFWNLRSTTGTPNLSSQHNTSMLSGFSPSLLNVFCEEGIEGLQQYTPWSTLLKTLANKRYDVLDKKINELSW
jgi:hypothetical protein